MFRGTLQKARPLLTLHSAHRVPHPQALWEQNDRGGVVPPPLWLLSLSRKVSSICTPGPVGFVFISILFNEQILFPGLFLLISLCPCAPHLGYVAESSHGMEGDVSLPIFGS